MTRITPISGSDRAIDLEGGHAPGSSHQRKKNIEIASDKGMQTVESDLDNPVNV